MAASVSSPKTCSVALYPKYTAAYLTALCAIAPENMTLKQFYQLGDAMQRTPGFSTTDDITTVGTLLQ